MNKNLNLASLDEHTQKILNEIVHENGFVKYTITSASGSDKGDGYIGIINNVKISGAVQDGAERQLNLTIKSASKSDALRSQISISSLFTRELYMYEVVFPAVAKLQKEKGAEPLRFHPHFYKGEEEEKLEMLIMENLKESGYELHNREEPMNVDHVKLVVKQYGRLHALSFALKDQHSDVFKEISRSLTDTFVTNVLKTNFDKNFIEHCLKAKKSLDPEKDEKVLAIYEPFIDTVVPFFQELLHGKHEHSVVLHGDCWNSNMMFKYQGGLPENVCFLDYQIARLGSPVLDLSYFICTCSCEEVFENIDKYLRLYHDSLASYLSELGSDPETLFPYSVFQDHWKRLAKYGFIFSLFVIHLMLTKKEETLTFAEAMESGKNVSEALVYDISNFEQYKQRVRPIIKHFVENQLL